MTYAFDPELAPAVAMLPNKPWDDPALARQEYEQRVQRLAPKTKTDGLQIREHTIPTFGEGPELRVRIYTPDNLTKPPPALLQIHGGGFVIGSLNTEHPVAVRNATTLGVVVVSVDYRLAPEHPYPAGLHDCYGALLWLHEHYRELQIDPTRIALFGTSAGAGLAAALTLLARDRDGPAICFQCLLIPELDDRLQTPSMLRFVDTPIWNLPRARESWSYYLGDLKPGSDLVPAYAAPARAEDLSKLPPAYINTMEFDPLRDEGILYALNLMRAGVRVELHSYPGTFHGSTMFPAAVSKCQIDDTLAALRKALIPL